MQSSSIRLDLYGHIKIRSESESPLLWVFVPETTVPVFKTVFSGHTNLIPVKIPQSVLQYKDLLFLFLSCLSVLCFKKKSPSIKLLKLPLLPPITVHPPPPFPEGGVKEGCLLREPLKLTFYP